MAEGGGVEPPTHGPTSDETTPFHLEDLPPRQLLGGLFHLLFARDPVLTSDGAFVRELEDGSLSGRQLAEWLIHSDEWSNRARMSELGPSLHMSRGPSSASCLRRVASWTSAGRPSVSRAGR